MRTYFDQFLELWKNRIFILLCGICVLFFIVAVRLFSLQIVHGEEYGKSITASVSKTLNVPAPRGNIYDRYGRPLAINNVAYAVQIDDSITLDLSESRIPLIKDFTQHLWQNNATPTDNLPISSSKPYTFLFEGTKREQARKETAWKESIGLGKEQLTYSPEDCLNYLFESYEAPASYTIEQKRAYITMCQSLNNRNLLALTLAYKLTEFGETLTDELPLATAYPYIFQFNGSEAREEGWKISMGMRGDALSYDSLDTLEYLRDYFALPEGMPTDLLRNTLGIRYSQFLQRYQQYQSVTISTNISDKTLAYIEEKQDVFSSVVIDTISLREYPEGEYFSHILGYIRQMTASDYALYKDDVDADGNLVYAQTDIVGQTGIEKLYERELNGVDGKISIEVDSQGRRISVIDSTDPVPGKDVILTLDSELQRIAQDSLESALKDVLLTKLTSSGKDAVTLVDLFTSMIRANHISVTKMFTAEEGSAQYTLFARLKEAYPDFSAQQEDASVLAQNFIIDNLSRGTIRVIDVLFIAIEQNIISATQEEFSALENGTMTTLTFIMNKLESGDLTPAETALDPCTGSVVVSHVNSGELLVSVSYPSYDNNELVNIFNNAYYNDLLQDTNTPLVNRSFKQKKAPGSTFKMVTAIAGLETGVITPNTLIHDHGIYKDAGTPYARCLIYSNTGSTHGAITLTTALEVSCNYFFYEVAHRLGSSNGAGTESTSQENITVLNEYMAAFGLNSPTGIELDEYNPTMASPYYKERTVKMFNPDATVSQTRWTNGDTIRAAIGQSINSYTPAQINRYIATLANGGTLYRMHMVDKIQSADGSLFYKVEETVENVIDLQEENLKAVYQGMRQVITGARGTLRNSFSDFPVEVAAKTGTAEEDKNRSSHTWLVCFAPYDDPQIAITVMIPFCEGSGSPAPEVAKAIISAYLGLDETAQNTNLEVTLAQ